MPFNFYKMSATTRFTPGANQDNTFRTVTQDYKNPAYAASIALVTNASYSLVNFQQLTGNVSLTAGVGNANAFIGDEMEMLFAADASNRTVTFSTGFAVTASTLVVTANKYATIKFIFNGTAWIESYRSITV